MIAIPDARPDSPATSGTALDATHDPRLRSWVASANADDSDFPIQNLPFGAFRRRGTAEPVRIGVAIGDQVLDLRMAQAQCPWGRDVDLLLDPLAAGDLAGFMAMGAEAHRTLRAALSAALAEHSDQGPFLELCVLPQADAEMQLPCRIGDFTDFNSSIHHATAVGRLFRPDQPLLPNYHWVPIGHAGRTSSIGVDGMAVVRPWGQVRSDARSAPVYGPSRGLDHEVEVGALVARASPLGRPVPLAAAEDHLFGLVLLNDWTARDLQAWEQQPLGPLLSKSFASTVSPWVVTMDALRPFRVPCVRPAGAPAPLPHLDSTENRACGAFDIWLEAWLLTPAMRQRGDAPVRLSRSNLCQAYWTVAQLLTHLTSNGCNLRSGDLLGTGAQSGPQPGEGGSLLELTSGGRVPLALPGGESRAFLQDGDTVMLRAHCRREGARALGFGVCSGTIATLPPA